jgi:hypothetical protein
LTLSADLFLHAQSLFKKASTTGSALLARKKSRKEVKEVKPKNKAADAPAADLVADPAVDAPEAPADAPETPVDAPETPADAPADTPAEMSTEVAA